MRLQVSTDPDVPLQPQGRPTRSGRSAVSLLHQFLVVAGVLGILEVLTRTGTIDPHALPTPSDIGRQWVNSLGDKKYWSDIWATMHGFLLGLGLTVATAIPLGLAVGSSRFVSRSVTGVVDFIRPIPTIAVLPLFVLLFSGLEREAYLVLLGAFFPLFIHTCLGVQDVDPLAMDTARAYRLHWLRRIWTITLPSATPYIVTGLRISATIALVLAVAVELVTGAPGLGSSLIRAQYALHPEQMYVLVATTGLLGMLISAALRTLESRVLHWHPSQRVVTT